MFLKDKETGSLIKIEDVESLFKPTQQEIEGRDQDGQEEQNTASFKKSQLIFPSGESLPRCWMDADYTTT
ncbi:MAG: acetyltransferase [Microcoleus vaginatus WJT46-NPBG5]|jgi:hypothetical protein|nr:acetyltransferase [Microcoleus vaginatus WJT46-NPBG5]